MSKSKSKPMEVRVHASVPGGLRRRGGHTFGTEWTRLETVPQEVLDDPYLVKRQPQTPAKAEPQTEQATTDLAALTELDNIGKGTATKLLDVGATRQALEEGTAHVDRLLPLLAEMQPAQREAVFAASSKELATQLREDLEKAELKAERVQQEGEAS